MAPRRPAPESGTRGARQADSALAPPGSPADERDLYGEGDPLPEEPVAARAPAGEDDDSEATRAGPPRKLVVLSGPEKGKVKRLTAVRMVIGRATGCQLQLEDRSISRRHLELIQGERGVLLRDLVSGNGTKVNGERVDERLLAHEDVIELGASRLQFVDEVEAVKKAREEADRKIEEARRAREDAARRQQEEAEAAAKAAANARAEEEARRAALPPLQRAWTAMPLRHRQWVAAAGAVVLLVLAGGAWALLRDGGPPPVDARTAAAERRLAEGRTALSDGRVEEAVAALEAAERIKPGIDAEGLGAVARTRLAALRSLEAARALIAGQRFDDARAELARMPEGSAQLTAQREALAQELEQAERDAAERAAQEALDALAPDRAAALIAQLPEDRQQALQARLAEVEAAAAQRESLEAASAKASRERERARAAAARRAHVDSAFRTVERKFHAQDFDRAVLEVDRVADRYRNDGAIQQKARRLKDLLPAFARSWSDAQRKVQQNALESALRPLRKAKETYVALELPGALGSQLDEQLADALVASAKAAVIREDLASGALLYREVLKVQPGDDRAEQGLARLAARADELYLEAYVLRDREPSKAIDRLKLVLELAPRGSDPYQKAQAQLARMQD